MTQDQIVEWMRQRVNTGNFSTAADLARSFCQEHDIKDTLDPNFSKAMDAGFEMAKEIAST
jgi:hypothetical protein